MGYDVYSYRPLSAVPSAEEAERILQSEEDATFRDDEEARRIKREIAEALRKYNPRLEPYKVDHHAVAKMLGVSYEQALARWNHIELNPPDDDLATQMWVYWDHVLFSIPYWYTGATAEQVFAQLSGYLRVLSDACGFFAYDPQTNRAFDPASEDIRDHAEYNRVATIMPAIAAQTRPRKPWWKFWW